MSEIYQPRALIDAQSSFAVQPEALAAMVDRLEDQLQKNPIPKPQRIALVGIGASHAAAGAAAFRLRASGIDAVRFLPSEIPAGLGDPDDVTIYISQSGRSAEVVEVADRGTGSRFALTNYQPSPLADICSRALNLGDLSDSSVSFVSFTGTLLALGMLIDSWTGRRGSDTWKTLIRSSFAAVEDASSHIDRIADLIVSCPSADFVAPAPMISVAEEAALMLREGPRIIATAMETRQYLHGPMDAAKSAAHVVFGADREALLVTQLSERTDKLVYITGENGGATNLPAICLRLPVPVADGIGFSIAATFAMQKLTLSTAKLRGMDINEPAFKRLDTKTDHAMVAR